MCLPRRATGACIKKPAAPGGFFFDRSVWSCRRTMQFLTDGARHVSGIGVCWPIPGTKAITDLQNLPYPTAPRPGSTCIHPTLKASAMQVRLGSSPAQTPSALTPGSQATAANAGQPRLTTAPDAGRNAVQQQIFAAVRNNDTKTVAALLDNKNLDVNFTDSLSGKTALMHAALHGKTDMAQLLLERKADINKLDRSSRNALIHATRRGNGEMVRLLLRHGAQPNQESHIGDTPLKLTAWTGDGTMAHALIMKRARINPKTEEECTALHMAAISGNVEVFNTLILNGANPNTTTENGKTPLMLAARHGNVEIVKALLQTHARRTIADGDGKTAVDHAVAGQHWDIVTLLSQSLAKSAEKQQASTEVKSNVAPAPVQRMDATMPALQDAVSLRTRALHEAVRKGDAAQAKTLIASGVDLNARMDGHATPLLTAVSISSPKMVEVLLAAGADTSLVYNKGYDLLMFAAMDGNLETALLLIQHRVDLNRRSDAGRTALSIAMESKNARMVELLRSHGASA